MAHLEAVNSPPRYEIKQNSIKWVEEREDDDYSSDSEDESNHSEEETPHQLHYQTKTNRILSFIPLWIQKLFWKTFFVVFLITPGLIDIFFLTIHPVIFDFSLYFWSFFISMQFASFFLYRYLMDGLFKLFGVIFRNSEHTKIKEWIERAAVLKNEIALALFSYSIIAFWIIQLRTECSLLASKCTDISNCTLPSVCKSNNPPTGVASMLIRFLGGVAIACSVYLTEKTIFQMISFNFHTAAYKYRIEQSRFAARALDKLNNARQEAKSKRKSLGSSEMNSTVGDQNENKRRFSIRNIFKSNNAMNPSFMSQKKHTNLQMDDKTKSLEAIDTYKNFAIETHDGKEEHESVFFESSARAKRLAVKLYHFLVSEESETLTFDNIAPYFSTRKEAIKAFEVFDKDGNGSISLAEVKRTILNIYKERRRLIISITDVGNALLRLHHIMLSFCTVVVLFIWLALFDVNLTIIFTTSASLLVATAFAVGTSAKNAFESIVFLFVVHPYDVGDRVFLKLDDPEPENLIVHNLNLLTTVFRRWDGTEIYVPNYVLATKQIQNMRRSGDQWDSLKVQYDFHTPVEVIDAFKTQLSTWLKNPQGGSKDFHPNFSWSILALTNACHLTVQIAVQHRKNWQDGGLRWSRREKFVNFIQDAFKALDIKMTPIPTAIATSEQLKTTLSMTSGPNIYKF